MKELPLTYQEAHCDLVCRQGVVLPQRSRGEAVLSVLTHVSLWELSTVPHACTGHTEETALQDGLKLMCKLQARALG